MFTPGVASHLNVFSTPTIITNSRSKAAIMKTREERREQLKRLAATPNGIDKLYAILIRNSIPFQKLPIGTLMIEAILDHEYPENR
jgi:hypothetical protein